MSKDVQHDGVRNFFVIIVQDYVLTNAQVVLHVNVATVGFQHDGHFEAILHQHYSYHDYPLSQDCVQHVFAEREPVVFHYLLHVWVRFDSAPSLGKHDTVGKQMLMDHIAASVNGRSFTQKLCRHRDVSTVAQDTLVHFSALHNTCLYTSIPD